METMTNALSNGIMRMAPPIRLGRRLAMKLEYDGTNYRGSQTQVGQSTILGELERALSVLTGTAVKTAAAGRTDAGAHAMGQIVAFNTESKHSADIFTKALNARLPGDIRVQAVWDTVNGFNPRAHATSRIYRYSILNQGFSSALTDRFVYHYRGWLDASVMNQAVLGLLGTHDFRNFCLNRRLGNRNTVRTMINASTIRKGQLIEIDLEANGFLPHQVRSIAGALVRVGNGTLCVEDFVSLVSAWPKAKAGPSLPAKGLCLLRVNFGSDDTEWEEQVGPVFLSRKEGDY